MKTNNQIVNEFLIEKKLLGKAGGTIERYQYLLDKLLTATSKDLIEYDVADFKEYIIETQESGSVSNLTLEGERKVFSSFFTWAWSD